MIPIIYKKRKRKNIIFKNDINNNRELSISKHLTPSYRAYQSKIDLPIAKNNRLTFDAVFNKQEDKKKAKIMPPIVIGSINNQPQINININNYNINNFSTKQSKKNIIFNSKKSEPIKLIKQESTEPNKIKDNNLDIFSEDESINLPHSNSNIIKLNKKVCYSNID